MAEQKSLRDFKKSPEIDEIDSIEQLMELLMQEEGSSDSSDGVRDSSHEAGLLPSR